MTTFEAPFGKIGLGICYDIVRLHQARIVLLSLTYCNQRFPEMAMIAARQGCAAMIYPSAFNTTTGPMHWTLLQKARSVLTPCRD